MSGFLRVFGHKMARHLGQPETQHLVYTLDVSDTLTNTGTTDVTLPAYTLSVGRADPLRVGGYYYEISNQYLGSGWLANKFHLTTVSDFTPGYIPFIGVKTRDGKDQFSSQIVDPSPLNWIGVENQFFTVLLTPVAEHSIQNGSFHCFNPRDPEGNLIVKRDPENYILPGYEPDIEASATFPAISVPAGKVVILNYGLYTGPKDFNRLDALGANQGELMNYGWFELLIVPMLTVLHFWFLIFHNYGVAIILLTLMIKAITWPLQSIANHSGKRMQALAPKLKELQARHKEHPEKLQTETFALYKEYGVNPFGGCLPALVQMPVFFSLYYMLQNAVELRGQSFLWVHDLTQPDTVASWALPFVIPFLNTSHLSIHPLPIMVTALTVVMMRMTPQIGDPTQAKVAQFMPIFFLLIFYNFAAALSLYYVINNCVSIVQIYRNLRKPLPELKRVPRKK
jgi:YidC/Oxa1 family membrane protein insertase